MKKSLIGIFLSCLLILQTVPTNLVYADNSEIYETEQFPDTEKKLEEENELKKQPARMKQLQSEEQKVPIELTAEQTSIINNNIDNQTSYTNTNLVSNASTFSTSAIEDEYAVQALTSPFDIKNNSNESVILNSGGVSYTYNILNYKGKDGMDLDINIGYNSSSALLGGGYDFSLHDNMYLDHLADGWTFNFTTRASSKTYGGTNGYPGLRLSNGEQLSIISEYSTGLKYVHGKNGENYTIEDGITDEETGKEVTILTRIDGFKEIIDDEFGCILRQEDRFGNQIKYYYKDILYYESKYKTSNFYIGIYEKQLHVLDYIIDSMGRRIDIQYNISDNGIGTTIDSIEIGSTKLIFKKQDNFFGTVYTLEQIITTADDGNGGEIEYITKFEYDLKINSYYGLNGVKEPTFSGGAMLLKQIQHPTGAFTCYEYGEFRRATYSDRSMQSYKITERYDRTNNSTKKENRITYQYEGDYSGYPTSYIECDDIRDTSYQYQTITRNNENLTTVYTFDYKHNNISKEVFEDTELDPKFLASRGKANKVLSNGTNIYKIIQEYATKKCYLFKVNNNIQPNEIRTADASYCKYMGMMNLGSDLTDAKMIGNVIYLFADTGKSVIVKAYDATTFNILNVTHELTLLKNSTCTYNTSTIVSYISSNIYYLNGKFIFSYGNKLHIYDASSNNWSNITSSSGNITILNIWNSNLLYLKGTQVMGWGSNSTNETNYGITYSGSVNRAYIINGDLSIFTDSDVKVCSLSSDEKTWETINYGTFPYSSNASYVGDDSSILLCDYKKQSADDPNEEGIYYKSNGSWSYSPADKVSEKSEIVGVISNKILCSFGGYGESFEKIDLASSVYHYHSKITNKFDDNGNIIKTDNFQFNDLIKRATTSEEWEYDNKGKILYHKNSIGVETTYSYLEDEETEIEGNLYYIPKKIVTKSNNNVVKTTNNIIERNGSRIQKTETTYRNPSDVTQISEYTYNSTYPGTVIKEERKEKQGDVVELLQTIEYEYNQSPLPTKTSYTNVSTYDTSFQEITNQTLTTEYQYDKQGNIIYEKQPNGNITTYIYNDLGWLLNTTYPDSSVQKIVYHVDHNANNYIATYHFGDVSQSYVTVDYFDNLGRVIEQKDGETLEINGKDLNLYNENLITKYRYNELGRINQVTDGNLNKTDYTYDLLGRVNSISNNSLSQTIYYDDFYMTRAIITGDIEQATEYDDHGRVIMEYYWPGLMNLKYYSYDYMGNLQGEYSEGYTAIHTYQYNDMGQLVSVTDAKNQVTTYDYNSNGNLLKQTTPGGSTTSYEYDTLNRLIRQEDAMGASEYMAYDTVGNLIASKDKKSQVTTYQYNEKNQMVEKITNGISISQNYDKLGNLISIQDQNGTTTYNYKYNNLLESITTQDNKTITYSYDGNRNVKSVNDYNNQSYTYSYDAVNRISSIKKQSSEIASYEYNSSGKLSKIVCPEGTSAYTYDAAGQLLTTTNKLNNNILLNQYAYEYDAMGNQTKKTETNGTNTFVTEYEYDILNRLTLEKSNDNTVTKYTFDKNNNIQTKEITHPSSATLSFTQDNTNYTIGNLSTHEINYAYNANNQLLQQREFISGTSNNYSGFLEVVKDYDYDANGNTIRQTTSGQVDESVVEYTYNQWNQMTQYKGADGSIATYTYDGTGMRTSKTYNDVTTKFYWDRGYISNEAVDGMFTANNYIGAQGIFARESEDATNYMFKNGHGDVVKLVSNGTVTQNYDFDAYGNQKGESNAADTNPFRYCGEYFDQESGLIYLRARYYDPSAGRFINEDPAKDGLNWYTYCGNNPLNFIDPDGMRYIPLRKTVEEAGGSIEWDSSTNTATVTLNGIKVEYSDGDSVGSFIQNDTMYVDDAQFNSDFYDLSGAVIQHGDIIVAGVYGRATGVDMTLGGYDGRKVPTSLQFFNVEAGIIKILKNGRVITVDLACVTASAHASISLSGIDLEAKLSLVSVGAEATVPIPGTNSNLELRVEGNIGFGATFKVGDGFKIGGSALVGSTISIKITKRN